ncbi:phospholysine phosphohistidine inorganic pyrophosphate phosphatase isoform X1 [Microtus oregoni]|uniref:phospholysine phosphohistidine inorganic pyrophosphate phosphatase isoform X1 n=1 Tax=Microtus oregoni TaxID=111838 RepID=UPI001BB129F7|nr:phospholysine phosphohistidine inorganic pyrophosphate phosphatase isoform X1 [Microtus oregoni]
MAVWAERLAGVRGVLLDISGVLYDSGAGGGAAIAGSVEAVARLKRSPLKVRFCTNESQKSRRELVGLLQRLGFDISEGEVTAPAPATCQILKERGLRPHLLVHDGVRSEFDDIDMSNPNCVVIADAGESFSYKNMNRAFQVLMELENPVLISLGKGRYYKETSGLMLDVGGYMKALEYACGIEAEVVGKPSPEFFKSALQAIGVEAHQVPPLIPSCRRPSLWGTASNHVCTTVAAFLLCPPMAFAGLIWRQLWGLFLLQREPRTAPPLTPWDLNYLHRRDL